MDPLYAINKTIKRKLPDCKMEKIYLEDFSTEVSPANEEAAKRALLEVGKLAAQCYGKSSILGLFVSFVFGIHG